MITGLLDHIWQSSLFAGGIGLLTLLFRRNEAGVRFWLWFAASLKFLLPFAALAMMGEYLSRLLPEPVLPRSLLVLQPAAEKISAQARMLAARHGEALDLAPLLMATWLLGLAVILGVHGLRWMRLRAVMAAAQKLALPGPVAIKASDSTLEPGLVGIFKPVVLLPQGLLAHLSVSEREAILAHEFTHFARRDNLTAALHMAVEALFWFTPPVWLIGARLMAERERACDEKVLAGGHDPEIYAGSIIKVCKFCVQSPLACASGASGADLNRRVRQIMVAPAAIALSPGKQSLLAGVAMLAFVPPIMAGFPNTQLAVTVKRNVIAVQARAEQAVTAVAGRIGIGQIGMAPVAHATVHKLPRLKVQLVVAQPQPQAVESAPAPLSDPPAPAITAAPDPVTLAETLPPPTPRTVKQAVLALNPVGDGDPDAVTCRVPQALPGSRLPGPQVCQTNRAWALLRAHHQDISPDGTMIVYLEDFQRRQAMARNCQDMFFARAGVTILSGPSTVYCF